MHFKKSIVAASEISCSYFCSSLVTITYAFKQVYKIQTHDRGEKISWNDLPYQQWHFLFTSTDSIQSSVLKLDNDPKLVTVEVLQAWLVSSCFLISSLGQISYYPEKI